MLTYKLKYKKLDRDNQLIIDQYVFHYTGLFYKLYNNMELMSDSGFINSQLNDYIDRSIYDFCVVDVKTKFNQFETFNKNKLKQIEEIQKEINKNNFNTEKEKLRKYHLINKIASLKRNINKNVTFGGKSLLRKITNLSYKKTDLNLLNKYKIQFNENRKLGVYFVGRACEGGNRKFTFDLSNKTLIFKPNRNIHIKLNINVGKNRFVTLTRLQELINFNEIPITVRLDSDYVYLCFDEEKLNGYDFNMKEWRNERRFTITDEQKKIVNTKWVKEKELRMCENKISNRYCSIDLNPQYIGFSILDKISDNPDGGFNIIYKECIDLSKLSSKLRLGSNHKRQIRQNNKRKYEISEVWKHIFSLCKHYGVCAFVMEDLNFKPKTENDDAKEFNRKTKNIWHRTLTVNLINKYCKIIGIKLIEINPCYSSFIGNMVYDYYDPISSSVEIGRRGIVKYIKRSSIFPNINRINHEKLNYLLGENVLIKPTTKWVEVYKMISGLRYRNEKEINRLDKYLSSHKSKTLTFC